MAQDGRGDLVGQEVAQERRGDLEGRRWPRMGYGGHRDQGIMRTPLWALVEPSELAGSPQGDPESRPHFPVGSHRALEAHGGGAWWVQAPVP